MENIKQFNLENSAKNQIDKLSLIGNLVSLAYSREESHIPSALSQLNYIFEVSKLINKDNTNIIIGKPFGSLSYYVPWQSLGWLENNSNLTDTVKYDRVLQDKTYENGLEFVDFSEEVLGNALGVALGYVVADSSKPTWVNTTDACLQMGSVLEPLLYLSQLSYERIGLPFLLTIDNNNCQVTGETNKINSIDPVIAMMKASNITVVEIDNASDIDNDLNLSSIIDDAFNSDTNPVCIIFNTVKGYPFDDMMTNPTFYHYVKLSAKKRKEYVSQINESIKALAKAMNDNKTPVWEPIAGITVGKIQ